VIDITPPAAPAVSGTTPTNTTTPTWSWTTGGGGNGIYRYKLDSSDLTTGATTTTGTSYTAPAQADGSHTLYVQERDAAGNWSASGSFTIVIDLTPPTTPAVSGTTPTNTTTPTWTWTTGGGNGTYRYKLDSSDLTTGATTTTGTSYTPPAQAEGSHTLYVQERDAAGNWSASGSLAIVIDITPPAAPAVSGTTPTNTTTPTWTWTIGNGGNGTYRYKLDDSNLATGATTTTGTSYTPPAQAEGSHTLYVQERDAAGNWSASGSFAVAIDVTAPTLAISAPSLAVANSSVSVTYTVTYTGADAITLAPGNVMLNATGTANGTVAVSGTGTGSRTVTISNITGYDGTLGITIAANTASDAAGNRAAGSGPSNTFTVDNSSGVFDGKVQPDMTDALKALRIAAGLDIPTPADLAHGDVAPIQNGLPHPDGKIDLSDVVVILRKSIGLSSW
jgi:hypothetical protein